MRKWIIEQRKKREKRTDGVADMKGLGSSPSLVIKLGCVCPPISLANLVHFSHRRYHSTQSHHQQHQNHRSLGQLHPSKYCTTHKKTRERERESKKSGERERSKEAESQRELIKPKGIPIVKQQITYIQNCATAYQLWKDFEDFVNVFSLFACWCCSNWFSKVGIRMPDIV